MDKRNLEHYFFFHYTFFFTIFERLANVVLYFDVQFSDTIVLFEPKQMYTNSSPYRAFRLVVPSSFVSPSSNFDWLK